MFLRGIKFFPETAPNWKKGDTFPSNEQPIQSLFWSDYAATPGTTYRFTIIPRLGMPGNLQDGKALDITVTTEPPDDGKHGIWFNRGIVASLKFATTFQNQRLTEEMANDVKDGILQNEEANWLSRGLAEAVLAFINGAKAGEELRVCAYEFTWEPIIEALLAALKRGVDVKIIYHAVKDNQGAIDGVGFPATWKRRQMLFKRTRPPIPHNKFIVRLRGGKPRHLDRINQLHKHRLSRSDQRRPSRDRRGCGEDVSGLLDRAERQSDRNGGTCRNDDADAEPAQRDSG